MGVAVKDIKFDSVDMTEAKMRFFAKTGDAGTFWRLCSKWAHLKNGAQIWVSKEVSDDLQASDITDIHFADLQWPHNRLEFFFEDPSIGTFLFQRSSREQAAAELRQQTGMDIRVVGHHYSTCEELTALVYDDAETSVVSMMLNDADLDTFAAGDFTIGTAGDKTLPPQTVEKDLDDVENAEIQRLALLAYKVLLFAASDGHSKTWTSEQPTRKQGGKAGFRGRPKTKRLVVEYLPHHRVERRKQAVEATKAHAFNGRRGHWRTYRSDRYVNRQGQRQFIYPVPGPDGTVPRRKFVVRK